MNFNRGWCNIDRLKDSPTMAAAMMMCGYKTYNSIDIYSKYRVGISEISKAIGYTESPELYGSCTLSEVILYLDKKYPGILPPHFPQFFAPPPITDEKYNRLIRRAQKAKRKQRQKLYAKANKLRRRLCG